MRTLATLAVLGLVCAACSEDGVRPAAPPSSTGGAAMNPGGASAGGVNAGGVDVNAGMSAGGASAGGAGAGAGGDESGGRAGSMTGGSAGAAASNLAELYCPKASVAYPNPVATNPQAVAVPMTPPGGISFLEGPVWLGARGVLLLSEWNAGHRILQLTAADEATIFLPASGTNGLALVPGADALLMMTEAPNAGLTRLDLSDKSIQRLAQEYEGEPFVQPNDLAVRADGTVFFTDYQAGRLYRRSSARLDDAATLTLVASLPHSNGVGISPDERWLYLNSDARTVKFPLSAASELGEGSDLISGVEGADGLAIDCAGNVYVAQNSGGALLVVSPGGERLGELGGLPTAVTNAAFGGQDGRTLFITTDSALYRVSLPIPGLPY